MKKIIIASMFAAIGFAPVSAPVSAMPIVKAPEWSSTSIAPVDTVIKVKAGDRRAARRANRQARRQERRQARKERRHERRETRLQQRKERLEKRRARIEKRLDRVNARIKKNSQ